MSHGQNSSYIQPSSLVIRTMCYPCISPLDGILTLAVGTAGTRRSLTRRLMGLPRELPGAL